MDVLYMIVSHCATGGGALCDYGGAHCATGRGRTVRPCSWAVNLKNAVEQAVFISRKERKEGMSSLIMHAVISGVETCRLRDLSPKGHLTFAQR